jgi:hypothetical protein
LNVNQQESWLASIGLFVAWIITSLGAVFDALYFREAMLSIASLIQAEQYKVFRRNGGIGLDFSAGYMVSFFDNVMLLVLAVATVTAAIAIEYYYRKGRLKGLLWKRIGIVFGIEVAIIVVSIIIRAGLALLPA